MSATQLILKALYPNGIPGRIERLVTPDQCDPLLDRYKINPVLSSDPEQAPRVAVSNAGEGVAWRKRVSRIWRKGFVLPFLDAWGPETRQMVDTDGSRNAIFYNDDLHLAKLPGNVPAMMCTTTSCPQGKLGLIQRTPAPPGTETCGIAISPALKQRVDHLLKQGATGMWAVRWEAHELLGVLWVSESRMLKNAAQTRQILQNLPEFCSWEPYWNALLPCGWELYPDAIEFRADGSVDLTIGFLPTSGGNPG